MEEIKLKCDVSNEILRVDYYDELVGIDIYKPNGNTMGLILNQEEATKLLEFLQKALSE